MLTGEGRAHHGEILGKATELVEAEKVKPRVDPRRFSLSAIEDAYSALKDGSAAGKIVVDIAE
jgi:NADPH:quinone reductase